MWIHEEYSSNTYCCCKRTHKKEIVCDDINTDTPQPIFISPTITKLSNSNIVNDNDYVIIKEDNRNIIIHHNQ